MRTIIAIVGRPNVGKSTLFNRIIRRRQAVVAEESGVTRDRHYANGDWAGRSFTLIDTGGMMENRQAPLEQEIQRQAETAIAEADVVIFLTNVQAGLIADDYAIANIIRMGGKKIILAVNKADNDKDEAGAYEFHQLGLGEPIAISALRGRGIGELLDAAVKDIPSDSSIVEDDSLKIAVVGRPNVGKSSLINAFLNEERHIVDSVPGTTRDSIDSKLKFYGQEITLIDTAGLRRPSRVKEAVEFFCNLRTERALDRCHIALVLFEAPHNINKQDARVVNQAVERGKGIALLANKWDLLEKDHMTFKQFVDEVNFRLPNLGYIPLLTISVLTKQRIHRVLQLSLEILRNCQIRVPTSELNEYLLAVIEANPPPAVEGRYIRIKYAAQVSIQPTVFTFHCNFPLLILPAYKRFLERKIRERYVFAGVPIKLKLLKK